MTQQTLELRVANLDCEHDAAALERGLVGTGGLDALKIYPSSAKVMLTYNTAVTNPAALKETLDQLGFPAQEGFALPQQPRPWRNPKVQTALISGFLLLGGWLLDLAGVPALWPALLYVAAILIGGYYFGREALEALIFEHSIGIELLMSIAALVAALLGQLPEAAMLVFLYSISEAVEGYTEEKTRSAVKSLMALAPQEALVRRDGVEQIIAAPELVPGDLFLVKPGQVIATDGVVLSGASSVNQAPVTGESMPVEKEPGDEVYAGSINGSGALDVRASTAFADNTISRIIGMVEEAQERKGRNQRFIERFGAIYSPLVLLLGLLIATLPPMLLGQAWDVWLMRATVFIVAAAPCALVISIPITMVATLGTGARQGVLIKGGIIVEQLARVQTVALDKTGTITVGEPHVTDILVCGPADETEVLTLAAALEARSEHPLARAVLRRAAVEGIVPPPVSGFQSLPGAGAQAVVRGQQVLIGSPALFAGMDTSACAADIARLQAEGKTAVLIGSPALVFGLIAMRDEIRENAPTAVRGLHDLGLYPVVMLTGDNARTAQAVGGEVGVDAIYAGLRPEDKAGKVRELQARNSHLVMVGDGVNDAPALAEAHVGVAMGAIGTDVALETADVALMADDLEKLVYAVTLARRSRRVVRQNLVLSVAVISLLSLGAVLGLLSLPAAVLAHEISEFVVIGSGLRMLRA